MSVFNRTFQITISALCTTLADEHQPQDSFPSRNPITRFVLAEHAQAPDTFRFPLVLVTLLFDAIGLFYGGKFFHQLPQAKRIRQIQSWRGSSFGLCRDFIRYFESLTVVALYNSSPIKIQMPGLMI